MPSQMVLAHADLPEPAPGDAVLLESFLRTLRAQNRAANTVNVYRLAVRLLARWTAATHRPALTELTKADIEEYVIWMRTEARKRDGQPFSEGYVSNQYRALQSFFTWLCEEEDIPSPMTKMKAPKVTLKMVPLISDEDFLLLIKPLEKAKDFDSRRDLAIIRMFFSSGLRIEELTMIELDRLDLNHSRATVLGKGSKERVIRFDLKTTQAVDRYLRIRGKHRFAAESTRLWLPTMHKRRPLTTNGIRHMIRRRARAVGLELHPHMFRHTFCSNFLERGGAEGDLMEQTGWTTAQMARRYGAIARSRRMQTNYDRIMGTGL